MLNKTTNPSSGLCPTRPHIISKFQGKKRKKKFNIHLTQCKRTQRHGQPISFLLLHNELQKFSGLAQHRLLHHSFYGLGVQVQVSRVLPSGSHQPETSAMTAVSSEAWVPRQAHQLVVESVPCDYSTKYPFFLLTVGWELRSVICPKVVR